MNLSAAVHTGHLNDSPFCNKQPYNSNFNSQCQFEYKCCKCSPDVIVYQIYLNATLSFFISLKWIKFNQKLEQLFSIKEKMVNHKTIRVIYGKSITLSKKKT